MRARGFKMVPGWTRLSKAGDKCAGHWRHESGWEARHCGHPTANYPIYLVDPAHLDCATLSHNGMGFLTMTTAFDVVARILDGELVPTDSRCVDGVRRVLVTAGGGPAVERAA